jgi:hypothetical protein
LVVHFCCGDGIWLRPFLFLRLRGLEFDDGSNVLLNFIGKVMKREKKDEEGKFSTIYISKNAH